MAAPIPEVKPPVFDKTIAIEKDTGYLVHGGKKYRVKLVTKSQTIDVKDENVLKNVKGILEWSGLNERPTIKGTIISAENVSIEEKDKPVEIVKTFNPEEAKRVDNLFQNIFKNKANEPRKPFEQPKSSEKKAPDPASQSKSEPAPAAPLNPQAEAEAKKKQTEDQAAAEGKKKQAEDQVAAEAKKKQTEDHAAAEGKKKQTEDHAAAEGKKKQAEDQAAAEAKKKQTEDHAAAEVKKKQTEDQAAAAKKQLDDQEQAKVKAAFESARKQNEEKAQAGSAAKKLPDHIPPVEQDWFEVPNDIKPPDNDAYFQLVEEGEELSPDIDFETETERNKTLSKQFWRLLTEMYRNVSVDAPIPIRRILEPREYKAANEFSDSNERASLDEILDKDLKNSELYDPHCVRIRGDDGNCGYRAFYIGALYKMIEGARDADGIKHFIKALKDRQPHFLWKQDFKPFRIKYIEFVDTVATRLEEIMNHWISDPNRDQSQLMALTFQLLNEGDMDTMLCTIMRLLSANERLDELKPGPEREAVNEKGLFTYEGPESRNPKNWANEDDLFALSKLFNIPLVISQTDPKQRKLQKYLTSKGNKENPTEITLNNYICLIGGSSHYNMILGHKV